MTTCIWCPRPAGWGGDYPACKVFLGTHADNMRDMVAKGRQCGGPASKAALAQSGESPRTAPLPPAPAPQEPKQHPREFRFRQLRFVFSG